MMNAYLILVAAGSGSRMGGEVPKQFMETNGKTILQHGLDQFFKCYPHLNAIVVVSKKWENETQSILKNHIHSKKIQICIGGDTRYQSVKNGLAKISEENAIVAIHDAARPLVDEQTIFRTFQSALEKGNGIPFIPVPDSLRELSGKDWQIRDRQNYRLIQTPQTFQYRLLKDAYQQEYKIEFTDDASVVESQNKTLFFVEGNRNNIKITYQEDFLIAQALLKNEK